MGNKELKMSHSEESGSHPRKHSQFAKKGGLRTMYDIVFYFRNHPGRVHHTTVVGGRSCHTELARLVSAGLLKTGWHGKERTFLWIGPNDGPIPIPVGDPSNRLNELAVQLAGLEGKVVFVPYFKLESNSPEVFDYEPLPVVPKTVPPREPPSPVTGDVVWNGLLVRINSLREKLHAAQEHQAKAEAAADAARQEADDVKAQIDVLSKAADLIAGEG